MSDKPLTTANGRIQVGLKELLTILTIIFTAGSGWTAMNTQGVKLSKLENRVDTDHDAIVKMEQQVEQITESVKDVKASQQQQWNLLQEIWRKVSTP